MSSSLLYRFLGIKRILALKNSLVSAALPGENLDYWRVLLALLIAAIPLARPYFADFPAQPFIEISSAMLARVSNTSLYLKIAVKKALVFYLLINLPAAVVLFLFSKTLLLFYGTDYSENGSDLLKIFAAGTLVYALFSFLKYLYLINKQAHKVLMWEAFVALFTIFSSMFFMDYFGIKGVGIAWIIALIPPALYSLYHLYKIFFKTEPQTLGI